MFPKKQTVRAGGKEYTYYRLVEAYRDDQGRVQHRVLCSLGRFTQEQAGRLAKSFARIAGLSMEDPTVEVLSAKYFGPCLLVEGLLEELGLLPALAQALGSRKTTIPVEECVKVMLAAHLFKAGSKAEWAVWEWQQKLFWHPQRVLDLAYHQLLRALPLLASGQRSVEETLFGKLVSLFDVTVDFVFYDLTSTYVEGRGEWSELLEFGHSRDGRGDCRQIVVGLVTTGEGFPVTCRVFRGDRVDSTTLKEVTAEVKDRFRIARCIWVSDAGLISEENVAALEELGYEYILGAGTGNRKAVAAALEQTQREPEGEYGQARLWHEQVGEEQFVVVESEGRKEKTRAILERRLQSVREQFGQLAKRAQQKPYEDESALRVEAEKILKGSRVKKYFSYETAPHEFRWQEDTASPG